MKEGNAAWQTLEDDAPDVEISWRDRASYIQARRLRNRSQGLCLDCPNPAVPGRAKCAKHLRLTVESQKRWRKNK